MITQCPKTGRTCEVTGCDGCWKAEQAEQEPVAWKDLTYGNLHHQDFGNSIPLYAAPVRTKNLTDEEIRKLWNDAELDITWFARAVIAKFKEKNRG